MEEPCPTLPPRCLNCHCTPHSQCVRVSTHAACAMATRICPIGRSAHADARRQAGAVDGGASPLHFPCRCNLHSCTTCRRNAHADA
eukprot:100362-Chlamydomonas_euryale.AAC.1